MTTVGPYKYVEENARVRPNDPAVVHGPTKISFAKLHEMASRLGTAMRLEGVRPGSVVLIKAGMPLWDYLFCIAALHEGAVAFVQTAPEYNPDVAADIAFTAFPLVGFPQEKTVTVDAKWLKNSETLDPLPAVSYSEENPVVRMVQTSGTTGRPKILEYDVDSFVAVGDESNLAQPEESFCMLPFSIFAGAIFGYLSMAKCATYFLPTGNRQDDAKMIAAYGFKSIIAAPTMISDLIDDENLTEIVARVNTIVTGGSALPRALVQTLRAKTNAKLINRMGSTEASRIAGREVSLTDEPNLVGKPYPDVDIRIVDAEMNELPQGEVGRIGVRRPFMRKGYRNNPEATSKHFIDGFFYSGDEGYLDENGLLYLVGREDERINSGGVKADPANLDAAMQTIAGVHDAAVFGFDQPSGIRGLAAAVVLKPGAEMAKVVPLIESALGSKKPKYFLQVESIPRNLMGKVERLKLEEQYGDDIKKMSGNL